MPRVASQGAAAGTLATEIVDPPIQEYAHAEQFGDRLAPFVRVEATPRVAHEMGGEPPAGTFAAAGAGEQGSVVSVDRLGAADIARDLFKGPLPYVQQNGQYYGLPYTYSPRVLVYNKTYFEKAGIKAPPTTWQQAADMAKALTTDKVFGIAVTTATSTGASDLKQDFSTQLWSRGGDYFNADYTQATFNSDAGVAAVQFMADLIHKQKVAQPLGSKTTRTNFLAGNVAMYLDGPWVVDQQKQSAPELQYDVAPVPKVEGINVNQYAFASQGAYTLFAKGKNHDAAWELMKFIASPEGQAVMFPTYCGVCRADVLSDPRVKQDIQKTPQKEMFIKAGATTRIEPAHPLWGEVWTVLSPALESVLLQKKGAKEALDTAAAQANQVLKENKTS